MVQKVAVFQFQTRSFHSPDTSSVPPHEVEVQQAFNGQQSCGGTDSVKGVLLYVWRSIFRISRDYLCYEFTKLSMFALSVHSHLMRTTPWPTSSPLASPGHPLMLFFTASLFYHQEILAMFGIPEIVTDLLCRLLCRVVSIIVKSALLSYK